ncbi:MAG TPA: CpsB/CapC family capsule biosynthesis tyrosine phosphatase [Solirubrobacteraceae bacterium]|nr:CpsB/CapC family capsule biosynthesis tyrosine phosphatase [Solirubrobacteraceae bacterium]
MNFTEIHFHLLPGIDDGPQTIEESVALAAAAAAEGTRTVVATPHVHPNFVTDPLSLAERVREVQARLTAERIPITVRIGGELDLAMPERLSDAQLEAVAHGPQGRRWVLLEAPLRGLGDDYTVVADELRERGFAIVVAHPERSFKHPEAAVRVLEHELAAGSALQINAWSLAGLYGERVRANAMALLRRAPRAVIASDAHNEVRMPSLRLALDALAGAGVPDAVELVSSDPIGLLERGLALAPDALAA